MSNGLSPACQCNSGRTVFVLQSTQVYNCAFKNPPWGFCYLAAGMETQVLVTSFFSDPIQWNAK